MQVTSWSLNFATGKFEGWGEDDFGNRTKFEEFVQLELDIPPPLTQKPPLFLENCDPGDEDAQ